jgi:hypothetical protein
MNIIQKRRDILPPLISDYIIFLIRNVKLFLGNALYRIIIPLFAGEISIYKTLLFTQYLITLFGFVAELTV